MRRVLLTNPLQEILDDLRFSVGDYFHTHSCKDALDLIEVIEHYDPDLIVLDLSMPRMDLPAVLETLEQRRTPLIATSLLINDYVIDLLRPLNTHLLINTPFLSPVIATRLLEMAAKLDAPADLPIRLAVYDLLLNVGVYPKLNGHPLLAESIIYAALHPDCSMVDELYPWVAKTCGGTPSSVEISMRRCIEQVFRRRNPYEWGRLFDRSALVKCPSNSSFIKQLAMKAQKPVYRDF